MRIDHIGIETTSTIKEPVVACIGYFDGIHLGHKALIQKTIACAKENQLESALITFSPDPWVTIKGLDFVQHLSTEKRRYELAHAYGIDRIIVIEFTKALSQLSPQDFINKVLIPCNCRMLICGFDFHYGYKGLGNCDSLKEDAREYFHVEVVESINEEHKKISTTRISEYLEQGAIEHANRLLGYAYKIEGIVVHGHKKGREIGFPTANLSVDKEWYIPRNGVYAGYALYNQQRYLAMINVGYNPTFNFSQSLSIEVNILDFDKQIYGELLEVEFISYIRTEMKFNSIEELIVQMNDDEIQTKRILI